jgi:translation elongation factor EF-Tu-like GTPase
VLRAIVTSSFALTGRGTALTLEILEGSVKTGEAVRLAMGDRFVEATVRSVEFVDHDVSRPRYRAAPAIVIEGLAPSEVPPGTPVSSWPT